MGRKNRSDKRKKEILKACYEVFAREGFEKTSFVRVARHINVTDPLICHYFGTKENMFIELVNYMFQDQAEIIADLVKDIENPEQRLNAVFDYYLSETYRSHFNDIVYYGCFYLSLKNDKIKEQFNIIIEHFGDVIYSEIKRYLDVARKTHIDPDMITFLIDSLIEGLDFFCALGAEKQQRSVRTRQIKQVMWKILEIEHIDI